MINKKLLKPINKSGYGEIVGTTTHDTLLNRDKAEQHPISAITDLQTTLDAKQAKLTAGAGIDITGDTISSTGGGGSGDVTLDTDQTITGIKTFSKSIPIEYNDQKFYIETTASGVFRIISPNSFQLYLDRVTSFAFYKDYVDCLNSKITQVGDPTNEKDATTKKYVDEEIVKVNSSLTNLAKAVNILVGTFDVSWTSKTTAVDAGTNLKTAIGDVLWSEVIKPENKNKYFIKAIFAATAEGTAFHEKIESYNILSTSGQEVYFSGATSFTHLRYNDPGNGASVETILMVNSEGNVRFYVKFDGTLNSNFSISKVKLFINEIF